MSEQAGLVDAQVRNALLRRVYALTPDELRGLDAAVRQLAREKVHHHVDKGFLFAWWEGSHLDNAASREMEDLFAAVLAALASGLTGMDVERFGARFAPKPSIVDGFLAAVSPPRPSRALQSASLGLINDALAPWDPRLAIVATWNAACAATLRDRLPARTIETLEAPWRLALGEPPA